MRIFLGIALFLVGCTANISMKEIRMDSFFHDNSSKVWLVDKVIKDGKVVSPMRESFKDVFIFYKSGRVYIQPLNSIGNKAGTVAFFFLNDDNSEFKIQFKEDSWDFTISQMELERVVLKAKPGSKAPYDLELIPLPEL